LRGEEEEGVMTLSAVVLAKAGTHNQERSLMR
jgi:hypothetical protein